MQLKRDALCLLLFSSHPCCPNSQRAILPDMPAVASLSASSCPAPAQKDLLDSCDIDVVLVGHAMSQDQEHAELFEIEW